VAVTLVSASCTIRKAATSTANGNERTSPLVSVWTTRPAAAACDTSSSSRASVQVGERAAGSPSCRRMSSTERSSASASLLACLIAVSELRACSGSSVFRCNATPDCMLIRDR
jgi:hypothetical protein